MIYYMRLILYDLRLIIKEGSNARIFFLVLRVAKNNLYKSVDDRKH